MNDSYPDAIAEHLLNMHMRHGWPHPDEYRGIHAKFKAATSGLHDIYSDETITTVVDDLVKQHTLVSPKDAANLKAWVNA
jgi:hypothetical protein